MATAAAIEAAVSTIRRTMANLFDRLDQRLDNHTVALRAIENRTRRSVVTLTDLPVGLTAVPVTWTTPYPDAGYAVVPTLICGAAVLAQLHAGLAAGSKTTDGCTINVVNTSGGVIATAALDVLGFRDQA